MLPQTSRPLKKKVLSVIPTCQTDGVEGGMEVGLNDECPGISTLVTLTSSMPISVVSSTLLSTSDSTLNTVASSTCSSTLKPVASSTHTSSTVTSAGTSAMKLAVSVASGNSSSAAAEVVTVKEIKSKGKRKLEIKEEDPLEKLVAIEERKVDKLWKDFFLCTKAYQDRDLAIKEKLLAMKEKEKELCDYSVFPTVNFPNEY
ncbi:uncharacterized protein LOC124288626 [Haliotis rubra]|uniref:uncharacterized protein LOC124288626 n=1 Tax=Haliotis rubra TaxID=36100 RepID=UPI001EE5D3F6|nr:uncharacterized protein LOC124288626 [Haliotis rubra]